MSVTIEELGFAPGKGMTAYDNVGSLEVSRDGMPVGDRAYMWVEATEHTNTLYHKGEVVGPGHFISMREDPVVSQIIPTLVAQGGVMLQRRDNRESFYIPPVEDLAENRTDVSVWSWHGKAIDQGDDAAAWGSDIIGRPVRLVAVSHKEPRYVEDNPALGCVGFADAYPFTVGSTKSLALVNEKLRAARKPEISAKRPRVSILLGGLILPNQAELPDDVFPEDYVQEFRIMSNGLLAVFRRMKACGRCPVPDTNEVTGERKGAPVRQALGRLHRNGHHADQARYGNKPELFWTQNFIAELPKGMGSEDTFTVERGAEVEVVYTADTNWL